MGFKRSWGVGIIFPGDQCQREPHPDGGQRLQLPDPRQGEGKVCDSESPILPGAEKVPPWKHQEGLKTSLGEERIQPAPLLSPMQPRS